MYVVSRYTGFRRSGKNAGFHTRADALAYLTHLARTAQADDFRVDGDPLDGTITVFGVEEGLGETFVISETSDPEELRNLRPSSTGVQHPKLP